MALRNRPRERPQIGFVTSVGGEDQLQVELDFGRLMETLGPLLASSEGPVYLVGGAVRDALLGRQSHDLDFAVAGDAVRLARTVADALAGGFFLMDAERGTARVLLSSSVGQPGWPPRGVELDFARMQGGHLVADLRQRDFTVNAMAIPAGSAALDAVIDPLGGQHDLATRIVRAASPSSLDDDPVRSLRAVRLAAELGLRIASETCTLIREAADRLPRVSIERVRDEFCRLLVAPHPADSVQRLGEFGLLEHVLPDLLPTTGVQQPPPHTLDVFDHTMLVLDRLEALLGSLGLSLEPQPPLDGNPLALAQERIEPFVPMLADHLARPTTGGRTGKTVLFLSGLWHDIGKPHSRTADQEGRIRFIGHEETGAQLAGDWARRICLSNREARRLADAVRHHMRPLWLAQAGAQPSRRAVFRFFRDAGAAGLDICLLSLADGLATGAEPSPEAWQRQVQIVATLLNHYANHYEQTISPRPLIDGRELMFFLGLSPGPQIGELLELILEAQAAGEISSTDEGLSLARQAMSPRNTE